MNALTVSMAKAVAADGITVNAISPGTIKSDRLGDAFRAEDRRPLAWRELLGERGPVLQEPLDGGVTMLARLQQFPEPGILTEPVTPGQEAAGTKRKARNQTAARYEIAHNLSSTSSGLRGGAQTVSCGTRNRPVIMERIL